MVEVVFAWPGMGRLGLAALHSRDYPLVVACTSVATVLVIAGSLLADLAHAAIDPRVRDAFFSSRAASGALARGRAPAGAEAEGA